MFLALKALLLSWKLVLKTLIFVIYEEKSMVSLYVYEYCMVAIITFMTHYVFLLYGVS